ncbi:septum formation family protein [Nocardioides sp. ChNu-153]|uniref:septum formation family protein n=1 Tax=unclassified Nocardioides TaxID=2615069 RepID=UPI0024065325|nr:MULTISPECIES: septum formation family protein [unclassified Nocardioides]MDF9716365.1 septum formation family protein [Nocardioides sp. ChNu-99]MDN7122871.1 septum formation family protein [Nocardioides sp. ChNu-153]
MPDEPQYPPPGPAPEPPVQQPFPPQQHAPQPYAGGWGAPYPGPPAPPRRRRTGLVVGLVVAGVAVVGLLGAVVVGTFAVVGLEGGSAWSEEASSVTSEAADPWYVEDLDAEKVALFDLEVGDCFFDGLLDPESSGEPFVSEEVDLVDCSEAHPLEVVGAYRVDELPEEDDAFFADTEDRCWDHYDTYAGEAGAYADVWMSFYWPTPESWEFGDREIVCVATSEELRRGSLGRSDA